MCENVDLILVTSVISQEWYPWEEDEAEEIPIATIRIDLLTMGIDLITHEMVIMDITGMVTSGTTPTSRVIAKTMLVRPIIRLIALNQMIIELVTIVVPQDITREMEGPRTRMVNRNLS